MGHQARRASRLQTTDDVRRVLARTIRTIRALRLDPDTGSLEIQRARTVIYGLSELARIISAATVETRLTALETGTVAQPPAPSTPTEGVH